MIRSPSPSAPNTFITQIVLFDVTETVTGSGSNRDVTFAVTQFRSYFIEFNTVSNQITRTVEADANSTYVLTRNSSIGLRLYATSLTTSRFQTARFTHSIGGGASSSILSNIPLIGTLVRRSVILRSVFGVVDAVNTINDIGDVLHNHTITKQ